MCDLSEFQYGPVNHIYTLEKSEIFITLEMVSYFKAMAWFWEYPCVVNSFFTFSDQAGLHTCHMQEQRRKVKTFGYVT